MPDFSYHMLNSFWQLILGSIINDKTVLKNWQTWSETNDNGVMWELFQDWDNYICFISKESF